MLSFDNFLKYYNSQEFTKGMHNYFVVETENGHLVIKHMGKSFRADAPYPHQHHGCNEQRGYEKNQAKNIYFATIFFFVSLCNHTLNKLLAQDSLQNFLKSNGWPMTRCGMAYICPPQQTLQEADLVYEKECANSDVALALFREVVPFMKDELNKFFSGNERNLNQVAYDAFCKAIAGKVDEFWQIADPLIEAFTFYKQ